MAVNNPAFTGFAVLMIVPQEDEHGEATITGNVTGLKALRHAIDQAIETKKPISVPLFAPDGEGYDLYVSMVSNEKAWQLNVKYWRERHY